MKSERRRPVRSGLWLALAASVAIGTAGLDAVTEAAKAQVSRATEQDIEAANPAFQGLLRGQRTTIDTSKNREARGGPGGPPAAFPGGPGGPAVPNPSRDPRDFSGNWTGGGENGAPGAKIVEKRPGWVATTTLDGQRMLFVDLGVTPTGGHIYQNKNELVFVRSTELRARRIYFTDHHTPGAVPTYNGDSIAHWEGNTLVVDTIAIKGMIAKLDNDLEHGLHHLLMARPTLHVVERVTKSADGETLTDVETWDDPASGKPPVVTTTVFHYAADAPAYDSEYEDGGDLFGPGYGTGFK